ncbi:MAG: hypothetical protein AAF664_25785 [Planctomycetota bacterium]
MSYNPSAPDSFHNSPSIKKDSIPHSEMPIVALGNKVSVAVNPTGTRQILVRHAKGVWTWQEDGGKKGKKRVVIDASQEVSNSVHADLGTGVNFYVSCGKDQSGNDVKVLSTSGGGLNAGFFGESDTIGRIQIGPISVTDDKPPLSTKKPVPTRKLKSPMVLQPQPDKYIDKPFTFSIKITITQP